MMKKVAVLFALTTVLFSVGYSQDTAYLNSLKETYKEKNVVTLKDFEKIKIDIKKGKLFITRTVYRRHFYTNNKAQSYAKNTISTWSFEKKFKIKAYTEVLEHGSYKKKKVKKIEIDNYIDDDVFYQDEKTYKFTFPALRENSISNLKYSYQITEPRLLPGDYFQSGYPIEDLEFIIDADENVEMGFVLFNFDSLKYEKNVEKHKGRVIYTYRAKKIPALDRGDMSPPTRYIVPHIIAYIKSYKTEGKTVNILRNTDDLYTWYHSLLTKVDTGDIDDLTKKAKEITADCTNEKAKVKAIFQWVQKNIKYIAVEIGMGGFIPEKPATVFKNKYGDCKGMAYLLHTMLKAVGITSYLTWVGTNELPYKYAELPTPAADDHMILTYIDSSGQYYFLDATGDHVIFGYPSGFIQGKDAFIDLGNRYEIKTVPVMPSSMNMQRDTIEMTIDNNTIRATGNVSFTGYLYNKIMDRYSNILEQKKKIKFLNNRIHRGNNKFIVHHASETIDSDKGIIRFKYDFTIDNYITRSDNEIFINMNMFKTVLNKKIKKDRQFPLLIYMKNGYQYHLVLNIPDGYKVSHIPPNATFTNDFYEYSIRYSQPDDRHLVYDLYVAYNMMKLEKSDFKAFNDIQDAISKNFREVVTLKKINE